MARKRRRPFPNFTLKDSLVVAQAIQDKNAGKPMSKLLLAEAINRKPASSDFNKLLSSSYKYGLTKGTQKAIRISLTPLGQNATKPRDAAERAEALHEAVMNPPVYGKVYKHYDQAKLPRGQLFQNTLERDFGVPAEHAAESEKMLYENGRFAGIIRDVSGSPYVMIEAAGAEAEAAGEVIEEPLVEEVEGEPTPEEVPKPTAPPKLKQLFIGHGKNKKPLDQLKKFLDDLGVEYKVAGDEPHKGRPISEKVAQVMRESTSGIFIATADEELQDKEGNTILRPSENVIYELGAASVLYGDKIAIFKEEGVTFPSDFRDIGYISFRKNELSAKYADLVKELVGFGILKISAA